MSAVTSLRNAFIRRHPEQAARTVTRLDGDAVLATLDGLAPRSVADVFERMVPGHVTGVFRRLDPALRVRVLPELSPRLALLALADLPEDEVAALVASLPGRARAQLESLRTLDDDRAGRLMDFPWDVIPARLTLAEATAVLRSLDRGIVRGLFLVDDDGRLAGRVDVHALAVGPAEATIARYADRDWPSVRAETRRDHLLAEFERGRVDAIPVVDEHGRLAGVVRYDRLLRAVEAEATVDLQRMVGAGRDETAVSPPGFAIRKRLPWLHINLVTAFLAAAVVGLFEDLIAQFTALAILLPVVAGQSGNAGSQALAVTIRGLALHEIELEDWRRVLGKEARVGAVNGLALAVTCGLGVWTWSQSLGLGLVIAVAMVLSMVAAGVSGAIVPIALARAGQDPATASSIILTTVTDIAGFFAFLGTATLLSFML